MDFMDVGSNNVTHARDGDRGHTRAEQLCGGEGSSTGAFWREEKKKKKVGVPFFRKETLVQLFPPQHRLTGRHYYLLVV